MEGVHPKAPVLQTLTRVFIAHVWFIPFEGDSLLISVCHVEAQDDNVPYSTLVDLEPEPSPAGKSSRLYLELKVCS